MLSFDKRFFGLTVRENWFEMRYNAADLFKLNAYMHVKSPGKKMLMGVKEISHTIENDLTLEKEKLYGAIVKGVRQGIRKAEEEDAMVCEFHKDVDCFVKFFNEFAASKKISLISRQRIEEIGDNLEICWVRYKGNVLATHSYLVDRESRIVRAYHSATCRLSNEFDRNLVGRANKLLHYKDMLHFKELGFKIYDFGGYEENTTDKSLQGINEFKLHFGGKVVSCFNYYTIPYYLVKKVASVFGLV